MYVDWATSDRRNFTNGKNMLKFNLLLKQTTLGYQ